MGVDSAQESLEQLCCLKLCLQCSSEPRWLSFARLHRGAGVTGVLGAGGLTLQDGSGPLAALILAKVLLLWAEPCSCSQCLEAGKLRPGLSLVICPPPVHFSFAQCNSMSACGIVPRGPRRMPTHTLPCCPALCQISRYCNFLKGLALPKLSQTPLSWQLLLS